MYGMELHHEKAMNPALVVMSCGRITLRHPLQAHLAAGDLPAATLAFKEGVHAFEASQPY